MMHLQINHLNITLDGHEILKEINLETTGHGIYGVVGLNGSGKTTMLRTIHQEYQPTQGSLTLNGQPIRRDQVALLETDPFFYPKITGREYLQLFAVANPDFVPEEWNGIFHLPLDELIEHYSTGMKKKIALLGVLSRKKPILMLDEPFNGLDMESNYHLKAILQELGQKDRIILVTSHILGPLTDLCQAIFYLSQGQIKRAFHHSDYAEMEAFIEADLSSKPVELIRKLMG